MELFGIALLPDAETSQAIVEFRESQQPLIGGPILGMNTNIPHMTILQCPFFSDAPHSKLLDAFTESVALTTMKARFSSLAYQHVGWIFADVITKPWMRTLQDVCLTETLPFIDAASIDQPENFDGYSVGEYENFLKYGYRYVGKSFRPHITLGRTIDPEVRALPMPLVGSYSDQLQDKEFFFNKLVFYRAGEYGALAEILESIMLDS